jgi:hypothetical protein
MDGRSCVRHHPRQGNIIQECVDMYPSPERNTSVREGRPRTGRLYFSYIINISCLVTERNLV